MLLFPQPDQHPDYKNARIQERPLKRPNTQAKVLALNNALAGLGGGLPTLDGAPPITLGQLQERLAELGPDNKAVGDFYRTAGMTKSQIAALEPTMRSQHLLMDSAKRINDHADKVNPERIAGTGDSKESKEALDDVRNADTYTRRVNKLHHEDKDAYKTASSTVAGIAAADGILDDKFDPSNTMTFAIPQILLTLQLPGGAGFALLLNTVTALRRGYFKNFEPLREE